MSSIITILLVYLLGGILAFCCIGDLYTAPYNKTNSIYRPDACVVYFMGVVFSWITVIAYLYIKVINWSGYENHNRTS